MQAQTMNAWHASQDQLDAIVEGLSEALIVLAVAQRRVVHLNPSAQRLLNFPNSKAGERSLEWYMEHLPLMDMNGCVLSGEESPFARVLDAEDFTDLDVQFIGVGESRPRVGLVSGVQVQDSILLGVVTLRDVTARHEAEHRFQTAFRLSPTATSIARLDDLVFIDVNESFLDLTGYARADVVGKSARDLHMYIEMEKRELALQQREGTHVAPLERNLLRKDGSRRVIRTRGETIHLKGEACLLDTFEDVTEQRRTEGDLVQALEQVMNDTAWFSRSVVERLTNLRSVASGENLAVQLTRRERQVLGMLAQGLSDQRIALELGLSRPTIRNYVSNIYSKTNVHSRSEAVVWARERGIVS